LLISLVKKDMTMNANQKNEDEEARRYYGSGPLEPIDIVALVLVIAALLGTVLIEAYALWTDINTFAGQVPIYVYLLKFCVWCFYIALFAMIFRKSEDAQKLLVLIMLVSMLGAAVGFWNYWITTLHLSISPLPYFLASLQDGIAKMVNKAFLGYGLLALLVYSPPVSKYIRH
jgi:hypothetical protein